MSIYINKDTKVITQGITGKTGQFHTEKCQEYANGKNCFVAGVNPKKAGESIFNIPIYASVKEAAQQTGATVSVAQVAGTGAIKNNLQVSGAASVTTVGVGQRIEQLNCYDLALRGTSYCEEHKVGL